MIAAAWPRLIAGGVHNECVSKAFTKDDGPAEAPILRRRAPLPAGVPNYVRPRGLRALGDGLAALEGTGPAGGLASGPEAQAYTARRAELEQRIAGAIVTAPPADRGEIRFGARVRARDAAGDLRDL